MTMRDRTEKLKLVFTLAEPTDSTETILGGQLARIERREGAIAPLVLFDILIDRMRVLGIEASFIDGNRRISLATTRKRVERKGSFGEIETTGLVFRYGVVGSRNHCFISIREKEPNEAGDWDAWTNPFAALDGFIEGWVVDVEYDNWQNAEDPLTYEVAGRDYSQLPMKSNDLPFPLEQKIIDTSANPGRWILRDGYVEAVASLMWLSELFWRRVGQAHKARLLSTTGVNVRDYMDGVIEVKASEHCFNSVETKDAQDRLRASLYG
ncbi:hypothetical protein [Paraburkholderia tropica]|uniref:hypothetical protein n=1 Tax=Paraburkholderia tropica TaxID=92647 RepID=UPI002AB2AEE0|nr:hypothetical protein [Paraburkholderia tropica]